MKIKEITEAMSEDEREQEEEERALIEIADSVIRHVNGLGDLLRTLSVATRDAAETLQIVEEGLRRMRVFIKERQP
jgi:hypothetical protein